MTVVALTAESNMAQETSRHGNAQGQVQPDDFIRGLDEPRHAPHVGAIDDPLARRARRNLAPTDVVVHDSHERGQVLSQYRPTAPGAACDVPPPHWHSLTAGIEDDDRLI